MIGCRALWDGIGIPSYEMDDAQRTPGETTDWPSLRPAGKRRVLHHGRKDYGR